MLAKRIIPCLDVRDGVVVKGVNFVGIKEVGDPVDCAIEYDRQGADEITFLDITATHEGRSTMIEVVRETARNVFVPLTVGGGIRSVEDFRALLRAGADKISVNSAAVRDPKLIMGLDTVEWARTCERLGAGEILLTSMDTDGCKNGFDLELTRAVSDAVRIPVIASGGCGKLEHFSEVFERTGADAALAASLFHFRELTVGEVKDHLAAKNIPVRRQRDA